MEIISNRKINENQLNTINKDSKVPLYLQIESIIEDAIHKKVLKAGDKLINEEKLAIYFEVSRSTVRQFLNELDKDGYVKRERAFGTTIKEKKIDSGLIQKVINFSSELKEKGIDFQNIILVKKIKKPKNRIRENLHLEPKEEINYIERLRVIKKEPFNYSIIHIPHKIIPNLLEENLEDSTLEVIEEKFGIYISEVERFLTPVTYKGNEKAYKKLKTPKSSAISYLETYVYSKQKKLIGYYEDYFSSARSRFQFSIKR